MEMVIIEMEEGVFVRVTKEQAEKLDKKPIAKLPAVLSVKNKKVKPNKTKKIDDVIEEV